MFSAQISSLVLDFITETGRAKPLWDQMNIKVLLILNCFFPSSIAAPDSLDSWGSGTLLHISLHAPGEATFTFQTLALAVLKPALQFECSYLLDLCPSVPGPGPCPCQKNLPVLWVFREGRTAISVYFAHQLALINRHTILSFVIKPLQIEFRARQIFCLLSTISPLRLLRCKHQMRSHLLFSTE